jgi:preprotein translocase subunit SecG
MNDLFIILPKRFFSDKVSGMEILARILPFIQIGLSALLIAAVLLQNSDASLGGAYGGNDSTGTVRHTRRGAEKVLFNATIILGILFTLAAFLALIIKQ